MYIGRHRLSQGLCRNLCLSHSHDDDKMYKILLLSKKIGSKEINVSVSFIQEIKLAQTFLMASEQLFPGLLHHLCCDVTQCKEKSCFDH
ncbi:hypothetical protein P5673_003059 [Acropora cervicornis]|uniref:Uncharacterized protein n=1 Tax=Acropora cervicornis TaxID=6130 RepID=A0AAD9VF75_ACRCE|nr:hypothetical protein P5673_003059 [Acropora cervicornis]